MKINKNENGVYGVFAILVLLRPCSCTKFIYCTSGVCDNTDDNDVQHKDIRQQKVRSLEHWRCLDPFLSARTLVTFLYPTSKQKLILYDTL